MLQKNFKILISVLIFAFALSGCISPKTDAFLLGAGLGAGASAYLLNGGSIAGYSLDSFKNGSRNPSKARFQDYSIPSELEWNYLEEEFFAINAKQ